MDEGKCMLAVTSLEVFIAVIKTIKQNGRFAIYKPNYWEGLETIKKSDDLLEQKKLNQIKLKVEDVSKKDGKQK